MHEADWESLCGELFEGFVGCVQSGIVSVVAEGDMVGVSFDEASVIFGEGGAEWGDGVFKSRFVEDDGIDLSFADEGEFIFTHGTTCFVEGEEEFGFGEEGGV